MLFWKKFINFITPPSKEVEKVTKTKVTSTSGPMANVLSKKKSKKKAIKPTRITTDNIGE